MKTSTTILCATLLAVCALSAHADDTYTQNGSCPRGRHLVKHEKMSNQGSEVHGDVGYSGTGAGGKKNSGTETRETTWLWLQKKWKASQP